MVEGTAVGVHIEVDVCVGGIVRGHLPPRTGQRQKLLLDLSTYIMIWQ